MFLSLVKWLLVNIGGMLSALLPAKVETESDWFKWDAFANCGCRYLYKEVEEEGHIFAAPCDNNAIYFWENKTLDWWDFNFYARDEGHADLTKV